MMIKEHRFGQSHPIMELWATDLTARKSSGGSVVMYSVLGRVDGSEALYPIYYSRLPVQIQSKNYLVFSGL